MRYLLLYVLVLWVALFFVDSSVAFKIFSPRAWRKIRFRTRKEHERDERRRRWRKLLKKTSAVPRGISPR